jgi:hypothetical protein
VNLMSSPWIQTVCQRERLGTYCRGNRPHANACLCKTSPAIAIKEKGRLIGSPATRDSGIPEAEAKIQNELGIFYFCRKRIIKNISLFEGGGGEGSHMYHSFLLIEDLSPLSQCQSIDYTRHSCWQRRTRSNGCSRDVHPGGRISGPSETRHTASSKSGSSASPYSSPSCTLR